MHLVGKHSRGGGGQLCSRDWWRNAAANFLGIRGLEVGKDFAGPGGEFSRNLHSSRRSDDKSHQANDPNPKGIHIRKHWHSANETHTIIKGIAKFECDGKRSELGPGSFNYMPAKMVHEAWLPADSLTFITVDGAWDVNWVEGAPSAADLTK